MQRKLIILTALQIERRAIEKVVAGDGIEFHVIGPKARHLPTALNRDGVSGIIMAGLAGGLDPKLKTGDVVIDSLSTFGDGQTPLPRVAIHTAEKIVATPAEKAALFRETGAAAVEMENAIARDFAANLGVPFLGVRAISDTASEALDPAVIKFVNDRGRTNASVVAIALARQPTLISQLIRLRATSKIALDALAAAMTQIVAVINS